MAGHFDWLLLMYDESSVKALERDFSFSTKDENLSLSNSFFVRVCVSSEMK